MYIYAYFNVLTPLGSGTTGNSLDPPDLYKKSQGPYIGGSTIVSLQILKNGPGSCLFEFFKIHFFRKFNYKVFSAIRGLLHPRPYRPLQPRRATLNPKIKNMNPTRSNLHGGRNGISKFKGELFFSNFSKWTFFENLFPMYFRQISDFDTPGRIGHCSLPRHPPTPKLINMNPIRSTLHGELNRISNFKGKLFFSNFSKPNNFHNFQ